MEGKEKENSRVPLWYLLKKIFKPLHVQDYMAIHFKFEIKIPLNQLKKNKTLKN